MVISVTLAVLISVGMFLIAALVYWRIVELPIRQAEQRAKVEADYKRLKSQGISHEGIALIMSRPFWER